MRTRRLRDACAAAAMTLLALLLAWLLLRCLKGEPEPAGPHGPVAHTVAPRAHAAAASEPPLCERSRIDVQPAPAEPPPPPAAVPVQAPMRLEVRDLWDGAPVPGLRLGVRLPVPVAVDVEDARNGSIEGPREVCTSAEGSVEIPADWSPRDIVSLDAGWRIAPQRGETSDAFANVLDAYRMLRVFGDVRSAGGPVELDPTQVELSAVSNGADAFGTAESSAPVRESTLAALGLREFVELPRPDARGWFEFELPRLPSLLLRACALPPQGQVVAPWRSATYLVPDAAAAAGEVRVHFELEAGYEVSGSVVDDDGHPVAGVSVSVHVVQHVDPSELVPSHLRRFGVGYSARWDPTMPKAIVGYRFVTTTDAEGHFRVVAAMDGELTFWFVPETEHHVDLVPSGTVSQFARTAPFTLRTTRDERRIRFFGPGGARYRNRQVWVSDLSCGDVQATVFSRLDVDSSLPARLLVAGHRYHVEVVPDVGVYPLADSMVVWDGGPELELVPWRRTLAADERAEAGTR